MSPSFDFGAAVAGGEPHKPALMEILPKGNHVCKITEAEDATSKGNYPQVILRLENNLGGITDWMTISPNEFSVAKLLGLIESAGLPRPDAEAGDIDPETGRLSASFRKRLLGREIGVIVRDEPDNRPDHFGEMRPRVQGYRPASDLTPFGPGPVVPEVEDEAPSVAQPQPSTAAFAF